MLVFAERRVDQHTERKLLQRSCFSSSGRR
jgi:hypothetical protein